MESLEPKQKKLEDILHKESHISLKERTFNVWQNIKKNKWFYIFSGLSLAGAGLIVYFGRELYQYYDLTEPFRNMENYLNELKGAIKFFMDETPNKLVGYDIPPGTIPDEKAYRFPLSPNSHFPGLKWIIDSITSTLNFTPPADILEPVKTALEQALQNYNPSDIQELVKLVNQAGETFPNQSLPEMLKTVEEITENIPDIHTKKDFLGMSIFFSAALGTCGGVGVYKTYFKNPNRYKWVDNLNYKRNAKDFKKKLLPITKTLSENPNIPYIYDVVKTIQAAGSKGSQLIEIIDTLKDYSDTKYEPIFEAIKNHPENYTINAEVVEAFNQFNRQIQKEEDSSKGNLSYSKIYLSLLNGGWSPTNIGETISIVEQAKESKDFFFKNLARGDVDETLFSSILSFYTSFDNIPPEKRTAIANYLIKRGNKQLASQLASCKIDDQTIIQYLSSLDEVPNIGVRGQVKTIVKLNNTIESVEKLGLNVILTELVDLLTYERRDFDENLIGVVKFLERHPNSSADQIFGCLEEYYSLTKGGKYKSSWIKKEERKQGKQQANNLGWVLDKKGERKVIEELERKVNLTRYERFNEAIDNLYYAPLGEILRVKIGDLNRLLGIKVIEKKVDVRKVKMTQDLANVILGYNHINHARELQPLLREILRVRLTNPNRVEEYLSNMTGNKDLEKKIGAPVLKSWKEGLSTAYNVKMDETTKGRIQEEVEKDRRGFIKCLKKLGYEFDQGEKKIGGKDFTAKAKKIFKEVSKYNLSEKETLLLSEAKNHLSDMKQKLGIVMKESGTVRFYDAKDPIEAMQMGVITGSCTNIIGGWHSYASVVNAIDDNKKVIYMTDETNLKIGRTLAILTDIGMVTYRNYKNTDLNTDESWVDFFHTYSKKVGVPLIVPCFYATKGLKNILLSKGAKKMQVEPIIHKAVCSVWYDDMQGKVEINDKGYKKKMKAYVIN